MGIWRKEIRMLWYARPVALAAGASAYATSINSEGHIAGRCTRSDGVVHAFLLRGFVKGLESVTSPNKMWMALGGRVVLPRLATLLQETPSTSRIVLPNFEKLQNIFVLF
jgi:hypothetical protein